MDRTSKALNLYGRVKQLHALVHEACKELNSIRETMASRDIADVALMLRKASDFLDDSRKECDKTYAGFGLTGSMMLIAKGTGEPLQGRYASAYAKPTTAVGVPSYTKEPEAYMAMCAALGVQHHPLTRLHFPAIKEMLTARVAEGGNVPAELANFKQYSEVALVCKEHRDSQLDADAFATL